MIKQILVDVDGVLFDSNNVWEILPAEFVKRFHKTLTDDVIAQMKGLTFHQGLSYLIDFYQLPVTFVEAKNMVHELLDLYYQDQVQMKTEVIAFLKACKKENIKLYVVSSNETELLIKTFEKHDIFDLFDDIKTCDEVGFDKRSYHLYEHLLDIYKIKAEETVVLEDTLHALKSAKFMHYHTIAVEDISNVNCFDEIINIVDEVYYKCDHHEDMMKKLHQIA